MRVIIVHTLEDALDALETAAELQKPVILQSAPEAIFYAGSLYLLHLFAEAKKIHPKAEVTCIVDCGSDEAEAINAMQTGHKHIRIGEAESRIADIAAQYGIKVYTGPYEALDLMEAGNTKDSCKKWLSEGL